MPATYQFRWEGNEILARARRALGRGLIGVGMEVVRDGKMNAHVISGTMRRSIHLAPPGYATDDERAAEVEDVPNTLIPDEIGGIDWVIAAGSWVPYACVEEVGRGHQFMTPALDVGAGKAARIMQQAFAEEGLGI